MKKVVENGLRHGFTSTATSALTRLTPIPTSVIFGGAELDVFYVASIGMKILGIEPGPEGGALFAIKGLGVKDKPEPRFAGCYRRGSEWSTLAGQRSGEKRQALVHHLYNRDRFYIHGRGMHGSDGCIVPEDNHERLRLNKAVKQADNVVILKVMEKGMPLPAVRETITRTA